MELRGGYEQLLQQEQKITASLIQGLNMLSLPVQAMYGYLVELAMSNPMLEIPDPPDLYAQEAEFRNFSESRTGMERGYDAAYYGPEPGIPKEDDEEFDPF